MDRPGDVPTLAAAAAAAVDTLLSRVHAVTSAARDREGAAFEDEAAERLLSDLTVVAGLLRSLNTVAADRLTRAAVELRQAHDDATRTLDEGPPSA